MVSELFHRIDIQVSSYIFISNAFVPWVDPWFSVVFSNVSSPVGTLKIKRIVKKRTLTWLKINCLRQYSCWAVARLRILHCCSDISDFSGYFFSNECFCGRDASSLLWCCECHDGLLIADVITKFQFRNSCAICGFFIWAAKGIIWVGLLSWYGVTCRLE